MKFPSPPRRQSAESIVPMINVVFLLLIFFMMSATITPAPPFDLTLPTSEGAQEATEDVTPDTALYLHADGTAGFAGGVGDAAWAALAGQDASAPLTVRADAGLAASSLAQTLARLSRMGRAQVNLVIRTR